MHFWLIFFLVIPVIGGFGNWLILIILGNIDMAYPRLNNLRFWILIPSLIFLLCSRLIRIVKKIGWTIYPSLSSIGHNSFSLYLAGISSFLEYINFIVIIFNKWIIKVLFENFSVFLWSIFIIIILFNLLLLVSFRATTILLVDRSVYTSNSYLFLPVLFSNYNSKQFYSTPLQDFNCNSIKKLPDFLKALDINIINPISKYKPITYLQQLTILELGLFFFTTI